SQAEICSQDVAAEVLILDGFSKHFLHVGGIYHLALWLEVWSFKADFFQELLHYRLQPTGADILSLFINARGEICNGRNRIAGKFDENSLSFHHRLILFN